MDVDRLARVAVELSRRVREDDPDDNGAWLASVLTQADLWAFAFVQAAVGRTSIQAFRQAKAWAARLADVPDTVDDIAVERVINGEALPLNRLEQAAAVKRLQRRGVSIHETARIVALDRRQVSRIRSGQAQWSRAVA